MVKRSVHSAVLLVIFLLITGLSLPVTARADDQSLARELIANGQFRGLQGWTIHEWYSPSTGKGEVILEPDGVKFKSTSGNNRIGVMQTLNVDVSRAGSLVLTASLKASGQQLDGTGWQGREAPVAVFAAYTDVNGVVHNGIPSMANPSEPQGNRMFWEGFYFIDPTGNSRNWHGTKVLKDQFYTFQFDLMTLYPKPKTIQFVGAEGAGWSPREGKIASLSLRLVSETFPPVAMEWDTNRMGSDYSNFDLPRDDPGLCRDACANEPNCKAWTYVKPNFQGPKPRCWLKYAVPQATPNTCCVSGVKAYTEPPPPPPPPVTIDLTGAWNTDGGGKYYIRQLGNNVWWYGEGAPTNPYWSNVAHGVLVGNELRLEWADVPKGSTMNSGNLVIKVESNSRLVAISKTGGFGGSVWTR
jgi:hypothetical protein